MAQCYDAQSNQYIYCSTNYGTYIAVGTILPVAIFIVVIVISGYLRYKRQHSRRVQQQQMNMTAVVPINNPDGEQQQAPYNYSYPPNYTSIASVSFDKPPSYEQTIHDLSIVNNTSENATAAVLPISTITSSSTVEQPVQSSQNQT